MKDSIKDSISSRFLSMLRWFRPVRAQPEPTISPEQFRRMLQETLADPKDARLLLKNLVGTAFPIQGATTCTAGQLAKLLADCSVVDSVVTQDSIGRIGINTTTPASKFEVYDGEEYITVDDSQTSPSGLVIRGKTDNNRQLLIGYNTTSDYGSIQAVIEEVAYQPLSLNPAGGNVGIRTTSPLGLFDIANKTVFLTPSGDTSGATDTSNIDTAISTLSAAGGGTVMLLAGVFSVSNLSPTPASNVRVCGSGAGATIVRFNGTSGDLISFPEDSSYFSIRNITWDCKNAAGTHIAGTGINVPLGCNHFDITDCAVINFTQYGIYKTGCYDFKVERNYFKIETAVNTQNEAILITARVTATGTVSVTNGSTTVTGDTGTGTSFTTQIRAGDIIEVTISKTGATFTFLKTVTNVGTNSSLTVDSPFSFPSGYSSPQSLLTMTIHNRSYNGVINANHCDSSGMNLCGYDLKITKNIVHDFKYGAGITTEQDPNCHDLEIVGNTCHHGTGEDSNSTQCLGIENWAAHSVISGNICHDNDGSGIDQGGFRCTVTDNICYDNSNGTDIGSGQPVAVPGISIRYTDSTYNASESVLAGNRCFDSRAVGSKRQTYGIEQEVIGGPPPPGAPYFSSHNVTIGVNNFLGNKDGEANIRTNNESLPPLQADYLLQNHVKVAMLASTAETAGLNIPPGSDPTSPVAGDIWINSADLKWQGPTATHVAERTDNKNIANGYAGLDGTGKVADAQMPTDVVKSESGTAQRIAGGYLHILAGTTATVSTGLSGSPIPAAVVVTPMNDARYNYGLVFDSILSINITNDDVYDDYFQWIALGT